MIDLSKLPPPDLLVEVDFEDIYAAKLERFKTLYPEYTAVLESDAAVKLLELAAYDEMMSIARANDAARASMLAYAEKADLDNRAADFGVSRLLIHGGDAEATPPVEPLWEDDERLRYRCQMALEGMSVAGPSGAYKFHALSASGEVLDVAVEGASSTGPAPPPPGTVRVWLLDRRGDGVAGADVLAVVAAALNDENVRPICDTVEVLPARPLRFQVDATIEWQDGGKQASGGLEAARERLNAMLAERRRIGALVPRSAIDAALHCPGVDRVVIHAPLEDVRCQIGEYPLCDGGQLR
ncbi:hypothetical protein HA052_23020 [Chromobacterium haemolyticum]|uniref:Baseplate J-like central domain-containing protein n=1 Tax=Chromobacterium fluminis TaxID=3044269 RepID=A0ABX0LEX0_9NEIS|nr:baseplate J/gp47 family protein [Chromobacterium haemolyticum]NHR08067.1 hypothetical protein [Chromobacterium haemolyticum]